MRNTADISSCGVWYERENGKKTTPYKIGIRNKINDFSMINDTNISDYHLQLEYVGLDYNF